LSAGASGIGHLLSNYWGSLLYMQTQYAAGLLAVKPALPSAAYLIFLFVGDILPPSQKFGAIIPSIVFILLKAPTSRGFANLKEEVFRPSQQACC
jgi:hypothetical protein